MDKHRIRMLMLLVLSLTLILSACVAPVAPPSGGDTTTDTAASGDETGETTITWAMWGSPEEIATHQTVADAFMAEHPEINVEIMSEPWNDYFTRMQTLWASGDPELIPDVLFLSPVINYAAEGVLENLDPYIEEAGYDLADYWPALLEWATYDGSVYGFPRDIGLEVTYYNKDIFDEVGIPYPEEGWTWEDFQTIAEQLTVEEEGRVSRYALGMEGGKWSLWVTQNNGTILDDMRNPSECTLDEPAAIEGLQFFADLMDNNYAMRPSELNQAGGDAGVFQSGQAAMIIQNASRISQFNAAEMNYDVVVNPLPADGRRTNSAAGAAWVMSAQSDNKDAAWTFLQWLQSTEGGQRLYTESGEIFPALQSTARSDAFLNMEAAPENRQAFLTEGENAEALRNGYFAEWNELGNSIINPGLEQVWAGELSVEEAVTQICQQVDEFLAANGYPK
jgi:multiple sugar transport system substrate-binding protein